MQQVGRVQYTNARNKEMEGKRKRIGHTMTILGDVLTLKGGWTIWKGGGKAEKRWVGNETRSF